MQIPIDDIKIKKRIRKNLGDLQPLMDSIRTYGLMNPLVVNTNNELIAGNRRLEAVKQLGWQTIEVHVVNTTSEPEKIEMEIDENLQRRNLTADELADGYTRLEKLNNPGFFRKMWAKIISLFRKLFKNNRTR